MAEIELGDIATKRESPMVVYSANRNDDKGHGSTAETIAAATRKLQIFCVVLLILIIISSVTIGVLIHLLMQRTNSTEMKSDELQLEISELEKRIGALTGPDSANISLAKLSSRVTINENDIHSDTSAIEANQMSLFKLELSNNDTDSRYQHIESRVNFLEDGLNCTWGNWSSFSVCTATCGDGIQYRERSIEGMDTGNSSQCYPRKEIDIQTCSIPACNPVDGYWTDWSLSSGCSVTCGSGQQTRQRTCINPSPANRDVTCQGASSEQVACQSIICPVNGGWSTWSTWSSCTNTGQKHRKRTCTDPAPIGIGRGCVGNSDELSNCLDPTSAFAIYGVYPTYSSTGVAVFSSVKLNIGGHYSTTTGKYTCYYSGIYVFSLNLYKKSGTSAVTCRIRKNGSTVAYAYVPSESESGYYESSTSTVHRLARGDTVDVGGCTNPSNIDSYTSFTGFLLKAD